TQRREAREDAPAAVVDDHDAEARARIELRHDPRRAEVVDRGEVADDAHVVARRIALAEERRELPVDPVRAAIRFDRQAARFARRREIPLADREAVAEVDAGVRGDLEREAT